MSQNDPDARNKDKDAGETDTGAQPGGNGSSGPSSSGLGTDSDPKGSSGPRIATDSNMGTEQLLAALLSRLQLPTSPSSGDPKPPKLEILKSLERDDLQDFIIRFERAKKRASYSLDVVEWISGAILYKIKSHGVDLST